MKRFWLGFFSFGLLLALAISVSPSKAIWWNWRQVYGQGVLLKMLVAVGIAAFLPAQRDRIQYWHPNFLFGMITGSIGFFFLKGLRISGMAHWPLQILGSSIPELGSLLWHTSRPNPLFASCLIPLCLMVFLISHPSLKWLSLGISVGVMAFLAVAIFYSPSVLWLPRGFWSQCYLLINLVICAISTRLFFQVATEA
ncbi:MAG: DUF5942 domain-containing protein [Cyanobacteria bacterium J06629_19]